VEEAQNPFQMQTLLLMTMNLRVFIILCLLVSTSNVQICLLFHPHFVSVDPFPSIGFIFPADVAFRDGYESHFYRRHWLESRPSKPGNTNNGVCTVKYPNLNEMVAVFTVTYLFTKVMVTHVIKNFPCEKYVESEG
jgi:hypothetical protein